MLTLILAVLIGSFFGFLGYLITPSYILSGILFVASVVIFNIIMSRFFMKKLTAIFNSIDKDLRYDKADRTDLAIDKLKAGYKYAKWQFMVKSQIDSQIGIILYAKKRFAESMPYLNKAMSNNYMAMSMLATQYFREKKFDEMKKVLQKSVKASRKDSFTQSLNAYLLSEIGEKDAAIAALVVANKKMPTDAKIEANLDALKNNKKIKMQNYGVLWLQLHLMKAQDGVKQYQMLIGRQKRH